MSAADQLAIHPRVVVFQELRADVSAAAGWALPEQRGLRIF